jgi:hypothetical protein
MIGAGRNAPRGAQFSRQLLERLIRRQLGIGSRAAGRFASEKNWVRLLKKRGFRAPPFGGVRLFEATDARCGTDWKGPS